MGWARPLVLWVVALTLMVGARDAHARGLILINTGETISFQHPVPPHALEQSPEFAGYNVGLKYSRFGLFWLDLWRGDGQFVLYNDTSFVPISPDQHALLGIHGFPITYRLPPGLLLILAAVIVGIGHLFRHRGVRYALAGAVGISAVVLYALHLGWGVAIPAFAALLLLPRAAADDDGP